MWRNHEWDQAGGVLSSLLFDWDGVEKAAAECRRLFPDLTGGSMRISIPL